MKHNLFLGMQFRRFWNFWGFADSKSSLTPKNSKKLRKPHRNYFDCLNAKNAESRTSPSLAEGARGRVEFPNLSLRDNLSGGENNEAIHKQYAMQI